MRHGYTNSTVGDGEVVEKRFAGPDAEARLAREYGLLSELRDQLPVPPVLGSVDGTLRLGFVAGVPGQDLLDADHAEAVLDACGRVLSRIHGARVTTLEKEPRDAVLVHGDFGPNNMLLDPVTFEVTAVVDWEFAHFGEPVEDLAWCEWIVRMHHQDRRDALPRFFAAYTGEVPIWPLRQAAMVAKCGELERFSDRWDPVGPAVALWRERAEITAAWRE
jgi:aminoglycoside phosphotransferase (APT) family kinase protein